MAFRWSRVELYLSVLTCQGFFATIRERFQYAPARGCAQPTRSDVRPGHEDTLGMPGYYDYAGAVHVHSTYSDGAGTVAEIAEAANDAGLDFVVMCDHASLEARTDGEDGWRGRTLIVIGIEVTTDTGHLLALDVPDAFLPTSNDAAQAQQSILDHGGIGFVALPCDLKDHWRDFARRNRRMGLEVFNLSAIARTKINLPTMALVWSRYRGAKPHKAFNWVAARPDRELRLWDNLICGARHASDAPYDVVVGIGSIDAHGIMKFAGRSYHLPTYTDVFRTLRTHILLAEPLSYGEGDKQADLGRVHAALGSGHSYMAYDNYEDSTGFVFECFALGRRALMGDSVVAPSRPDQPDYRLVVSAPKTRSLIRLYRDGKLVAVNRGGRLEHVTREPGAYRAEVYLFRQRIGNLCINAKPWIFSNPIYIQPVSVAPDATQTPAADETSTQTNSQRSL